MGAIIGAFPTLTPDERVPEPNVFRMVSMRHTMSALPACMLALIPLPSLVDRLTPAAQRCARQWSLEAFDSLAHVLLLSVLLHEGGLDEAPGVRSRVLYAIVGIPMLPHELLELIATLVPCPKTFLVLLHALPSRHLSAPLQSLLALSRTPHHAYISIAWPRLVLKQSRLPLEATQLLERTLDMLLHHFAPYMRRLTLCPHGNVCDDMRYLQDALTACCRLEELVLDVRHDPRSVWTPLVVLACRMPGLASLTLKLPKHAPYAATSICDALVALLHTQQCTALHLTNVRFQHVADRVAVHRALLACTSLRDLHLDSTNLSLLFVPHSVTRLSLWARDDAARIEMAEAMQALARLEQLQKLTLCPQLTQPLWVLEAFLRRQLPHLERLSVRGASFASPVECRYG
ncbi:hypothetical protein SDRG_07016 [Saprolegnia diclina VS20]|uniref:F-box domain-containing protein n=2 Tax=Saprolegnia diclina (strain VS20) TaxID=1156394 RepID=T0QNA0_SAPDV|nr:hypothetical protein SDRG_07016 [Saprolegnia diclina VS20]EQC35305.1 hypothetical protein SDRG_07016 [Saprolegnia diclina VS20]|eukprot:XP_008611055.1 hypothetical protein SDRG_07016 [Saprolegnia diclina VS20]